MDINWRTAKKYADKDNWNKVVKKIKRTSPVMEDYKEIVDTWFVCLDFFNSYLKGVHKFRPYETY